MGLVGLDTIVKSVEGIAKEFIKTGMGSAEAKALSVLML